MSKSLSAKVTTTAATDNDGNMWFGSWSVERIAAGVSYLVSPDDAKVARMDTARATAIAAALNTAQGGDEYRRVHGDLTAGVDGRKRVAL